MPRISAFYGIVIYMNWREHQPPHFHAVYGDDEVSVGIIPVAILSGGLPPRALTMVLDWATLHQRELRRDWDRAQALKPRAAIPPLP
jgi:hypothetical protein